MKVGVGEGLWDWNIRCIRCYHKEDGMAGKAGNKKYLLEVMNRVGGENRVVIDVFARDDEDAERKADQIEKAVHAARSARSVLYKPIRQW